MKGLRKASLFQTKDTEIIGSIALRLWPSKTQKMIRNLQTYKLGDDIEFETS